MRLIACRCQLKLRLRLCPEHSCGSEVHIDACARWYQETSRDRIDRDHRADHVYGDAPRGSGLRSISDPHQVACLHDRAIRGGLGLDVSPFYLERPLEADSVPQTSPDEIWLCRGVRFEALDAR